MSAADSNHHTPRSDRNRPAVLPKSDADCVWWPQNLRVRRFISEVMTLVLWGSSALIVLVLVAVRGWPRWWLVIAGMLIAWAGDALWTVGTHTISVVRHRSTAKDRGGEETAERTTPRVIHLCRREQACRAGDHQ